MQTPNSGWIDDQILDPPEQYWRIGEYLVEDRTIEEVEKDVFIPFIHRPLSRYVNAMAAAGLVIHRMEEPAPPDGLPRARGGVRGRRDDPAPVVPSCGEGALTRDGRRYHQDVSEFLVVTGLSGAGRSQAAVTLEDLGWFIVDNLPATLIPTIADLAGAPGSSIGRVALVVGRGPNPGDVLPALVQLRAGGHRVRILFLDAPTDVLVRRYSSTRRRHPLADEAGAMTDAIERERLLFEPVKAEADLVVDTGDLNVHQLRDRLMALFGG